MILQEDAKTDFLNKGRHRTEATITIVVALVSDPKAGRACCSVERRARTESGLVWQKPITRRFSPGARIERAGRCPGRAAFRIDSQRLEIDGHAVQLQRMCTCVRFVETNFAADCPFVIFAISLFKTLSPRPPVQLCTGSSCVEPAIDL